MGKYIGSAHRRSEYPDKPVTSIAYLHIREVPEWLEAKGEQDILKEMLKEYSSGVARYLNDQTDSEISFRDGSLIIEIIQSCNLNEILSERHLKDMGLWVEGMVIAGVTAGTAGYITHCTFRSLNKLEREIKHAMNSLSLYVLLKIKSSLRDKRTGAIVQQARTRIIGNLRRYYEAIESARNDRITVERRLAPMKRAHSNAEDIEKTVTNIDDRAFLCNLMGELLKLVKPIAYAENKKAHNFNDLLKKTRHIVFEKIC